MFGFKKKEIKNNANEDSQIITQTIPDIFYGGNDPDIYKTATAPGSQKGNNLNNGGDKNIPALDNGAGKKRKKIILITLAVLFFAAVVGVISWYYLRDYWGGGVTDTTAQKSPAAATTTIETKIETPVEAPVVIPETTIVTQPPAVPTSTISLDIVSDFPPDILIDTSDFDADALTDSEEEVFGTDMSLWDTDNDGYYDGQEINNLYNPKGFAPVKLIDSGLIREYVSSIWNYRIYYPAKWQVGAVDNEGRQVLFSDAGGDYIEVRIVNRNPGEDFVTWFGRHIKGQRAESLLQMQNRFETNLWKRNDDLTAYMPSTNWVAVLIYHPMANSPIKSRHIMQMAVQSFRVGQTQAQIPSQPILSGTLPANASINAEPNSTITSTSSINTLTPISTTSVTSS